MDHEDDYTCRICLESSVREDVIAPCSCRGSSKWVHRTCLDQWRTTREDKAFSKCTECLSEYTLITRIDDSYRPKLMRRANFFFFVLRDLSVAFLLLQMLIIGMSGIIYISDEKSHWLVSYFHSEAHIRLFYYSCGAVIFFSLVGLLYFTGFATTNGARCSPQICSNCSICNHHSSSGNYYGNSFDLPINWCMCYDCGGFGCGECSCCEAGCSNACASLPSELLPVLMLCVVLLACVGAMVAVFAGMLYLERVIASHVHLLQKEALARDFIVADLDDVNISPDMDTFPNDDICMTNLSPMNSLEDPPLLSSSRQHYDDSGHSSIHTDQVALTVGSERPTEYQSSIASGQSAIFYRHNGGRSEVNRALSQTQRRELTALGLM